MVGWMDGSTIHIAREKSTIGCLMVVLLAAFQDATYNNNSTLIKSKENFILIGK